MIPYYLGELVGVVQQSSSNYHKPKDYEQYSMKYSKSIKRLQWRHYIHYDIKSARCSCRANLASNEIRTWSSCWQHIVHCRYWSRTLFICFVYSSFSDETSMRAWSRFKELETNFCIKNVWQVMCVDQQQYHPWRLSILWVLYLFFSLLRWPWRKG